MEVIVNQEVFIFSHVISLFDLSFVTFLYVLESFTLIPRVSVSRVKGTMRIH